MTEINLVPIIPKGFLALNLAQAIENQLDMTAKAIQVDFETTTRTWDERPQFKIDKIKLGRRIYTNDEIYGYIAHGTKPHIIKARNANNLAFFANGFAPKTRVGYIGSNKGRQAGKDFRTPKEVHHPGTQARDYERVIKEKWDNEAPRQVQRAIRNELEHRR
jgi:hypothetical protein